MKNKMQDTENLSCQEQSEIKACNIELGLLRVGEGYEGPSEEQETADMEILAKSSMRQEQPEEDLWLSSSVSDDFERQEFEMPKYKDFPTCRIERIGDFHKNLDASTSTATSMVFLENRKGCPRKDFSYMICRRHNYLMALDYLQAKLRTKGLKRKTRLKLFIEEFFFALDKFVYIANCCLRSIETEEADEDFNFALSWIRNAFRCLGMDSARYYANEAPGPYSGWNADISFLMNRYFFSPEFNHVNGFDIEEHTHGNYGFVKHAKGWYSLAYVPYPGYYDASADDARFCSVCNFILPQHVSISSDEQSK